MYVKRVIVNPTRKTTRNAVLRSYSSYPERFPVSILNKAATGIYQTKTNDLNLFNIRLIIYKWLFTQEPSSASFYEFKF